MSVCGISIEDVMPFDLVVCLGVWGVLVVRVDMLFLGGVWRLILSAYSWSDAWYGPLFVVSLRLSFVFSGGCMFNCGLVHGRCVL